MAGPNPGEVWFYKDGKYCGTVWKFDDSKPDLEDLGCDEKISSLKVGPGVTVILFSRKKYEGDSLEFNCDAHTLGRWNDKARSVKILKEAPWSPTPGPGEVYAYRDANFESFVWRLRESVPSFERLGARNKISSIRVGPSTECVLYDSDNYGGKVLTVGHNMGSLGDFNDKGSSLKIFKSA